MKGTGLNASNQTRKQGGAFSFAMLFFILTEIFIQTTSSTFATSKHASATLKYYVIIIFSMGAAVVVVVVFCTRVL